VNCDSFSELHVAMAVLKQAPLQFLECWEPLPAELKMAYCSIVWRSSGEYRMKLSGSRPSTLIKRENAYQREATDADAAGFPSFSSGDDGGNARHNAYLGANAFGRTGRY
jgi:hypothetical protein